MGIKLIALDCDDTFVFLPLPKVHQCSEEMFLLAEKCLGKCLPEIEEKLICVNTRRVDPNDVSERLEFEYVFIYGKITNGISY